MGLDDLRKRIDSLDDAILKLLDERASIVSDVAKAKRESQLPVFDPERERNVLDRLAAQSDRFPREAIRAVYREVMSACLALQEPMRVAFLGPQGTFSHAAARETFGLAARYAEQATIEGVFDAVQRGDAALGIVPIENSTEGSVNHAVDALMEGSVLIHAERGMPVSHALLTRASGLGGVERVYSHVQALGQCRRWLAKNLPSAQVIQTWSTTAAVREAESDPRAAAIASRFASEIHGVPVLADAIQDRAENMTRFVVIANEDAERTGDDKTTMAFSVQDGQGALKRVLDVFDDERISLTRIESRPSQKRVWDYVFLVDLRGHRHDEPLQKATARLATICPMVKHLGSYPRATRLTLPPPPAPSSPEL